MNSDCIFCKIVKNKEANPFLFEDKLTAAFPDISPKAPTHILLIPKRHIENINEIEMDLSKALFSAINKVTQDLKGFRVVFNFGREAGQAVPHLHFHILSGRKFDWPPG